MYCPRCDGNNIDVVNELLSSKTRNKSIGFCGHVNNFARATTAVCTLGVSNLVWKKSKGEEYTKYDNRTTFVCKDCGNKWEVNQKR